MKQAARHSKSIPALLGRFLGVAAAKGNPKTRAFGGQSCRTGQT
jgi:hypothetical protein